MTAQAARTRRTTTVGDDARVRMRVVGTPTEGTDPAGSLLESARTRAIPQNRIIDHAHNVISLASLHVTDATEAAASSWVATDRPRTIGDAARAVLPEPGQASGRLHWAALTTAGLLRLAGTTVGWLWVLAFHTRIRATVTTVLLLLLLGAHTVVAHL